MCSLFSGGGSETGERQHRCHVAHVGLVHIGRAAQMTLAGGALLGEDVALERLSTLDGTAGADAEALLGAALGLHLGQEQQRRPSW